MGGSEGWVGRISGWVGGMGRSEDGWVTGILLAMIRVRDDFDFIYNSVKMILQLFFAVPTYNSSNPNLDFYL